MHPAKKLAVVVMSFYYKLHPHIVQLKMGDPKKLAT
jgi:hypothetical protein